jgi:hypothetical protein
MGGTEVENNRVGVPVDDLGTINNVVEWPRGCESV